MWANVCCSKYGHSRVEPFRLHLKHNNDFTKLIFKEDHLPRHMRLPFSQRFIRFLFVPITMMAALMLLNHTPIYRELAEFCKRRDECFANCARDNFPKLSCSKKKVKISYNGNLYEDFFVYPKIGNSTHFEKCRNYIEENPNHRMAEGEGKPRQMQVHTCFESCKRPKDCLTGFNIDGREECPSH